MTERKDEHPKCFISYSWDNKEHKDWVRKLAADLQRNGVDVSLDQWDTHPGIDLTEYMETCIRESDYVLLICTPTFAKKANASRGGVGYEKNIVTGEIFEGAASPKKFVPLLRAGEPTDSRPSYLKSKAYVDFRNDSRFDKSLEELLRHVYASPKYIKPPLGEKPLLESATIEGRQEAGQSYEQTAVAGLEQIFLDDFCNGLDKWDSICGTAQHTPAAGKPSPSMQLVPRIQKQEPDTFAICSSIGDFKDGIIECDVKIQPGSMVNIAFRANIEKYRWYMARFDTRSGKRFVSTFLVNYESDCKWYPIGETINYKAPDKMWLHMKVSVRGNEMILFCGEKKVAWATNEDFSSGKVGIFNEGDQVYVDNFKVSVF